LSFSRPSAVRMTSLGMEEEVSNPRRRAGSGSGGSAGDAAG
jgi:hypothetical protein